MNYYTLILFSKTKWTKYTVYKQDKLDFLIMEH